MKTLKLCGEIIKKKNGITLIALVVTIVVLIILAVISINAVLGENGLITNAQKAEKEYIHAEVWETMQMEYSSYWADKVANKETSLVSYLQGKKIIAEEQTNGGYKIDTEKLLGSKVALGNGEGEEDVYKLVEVGTSEEKKYQVMYYGKDASENRELGTLGDSTTNSNNKEEDEEKYSISRNRIRRVNKLEIKY